ncbi:PH domain-containing protein [Kosmotoga olearia]|uniref:Bacterial Pleckstrin homology domain-containing protein n=1 Tax=Kosmotoga olearia (strain ATCC BAA-1733 / DSM 21960 / TBF 19.5.1) TaxID=521045 RepID=C5CH43_KOSOT|nr:PH domain-containing protein [Kosmotoga olearia]ACR80646.1 hypothetical protein Kole_1965 [Kosmotoga olearia TBF 19.5.1]
MKEQTLVVKPPPSLGWIIVLGLAIICLTPLWILLFFQPSMRLFLALLPAILSGCGFGIFFLLYVIVYFKMKYICTDTHLLLRCGWYKKDIPYSEIEKIAIENMRVYPLASTEGFIKFPGYALGRVQYLDKGKVYMCARRVNRRILLLYLKNGEKVGITPKDMEGFKEFLMQKAGLTEKE